MAILRGKGKGLEISLGGEFEPALVELKDKLGERPGFYAGTPATAAFGTRSPIPDELERLNAALAEHGIPLVALRGNADVRACADERGLRYECDDGGEELARRRAMRPLREVQLSDAARSLVADFAGARSDIAARRKNGQGSVRRALPATPLDRKVRALEPIAAQQTTTHYHTGTLRGGQSVHHVGNIVVVGDVNPGAELVATGDIVVFGSLHGVAHAGAQGDEGARVYAIDLAPTQLRIAALIAASAASGKRGPFQAFIEGDRIVIKARENARK